MDRIVSTVYYEGVVLIFTERGKIYVMRKDYSGQLTVKRTLQVDIEP